MHPPKVKEELELRQIETHLSQFARKFYDALVRRYNTAGDYPEAADELDCTDELVSMFPPGRSDQEIRYLLSKTGLKWGRINDQDQDNPEFATVETDHVLDEIVAEATERRPDQICDLRQTGPIFYRADVDMYGSIDIPADVQARLHARFFENPTRFIESCRLIGRGTEEFGSTIADIWGIPYDFTRVRTYKNLVFKRVELDKVRYAEEERDEAGRIGQLIDGFDPRVGVQQTLGYVWDRGNVYLVSKRIPGESAYELQAVVGETARHAHMYGGSDLWGNSETEQMIKTLGQILQGEHEFDHKNVIVELWPGKRYLQPDSVKRMTIIDFETKPNGLTL
ncbi:MAG: hypothetical protein ABH879_06055 [archaeon]